MSSSITFGPLIELPAASTAPRGDKPKRAYVETAQLSKFMRPAPVLPLALVSAILERDREQVINLVMEIYTCSPASVDALRIQLPALALWLYGMNPCELNRRLCKFADIERKLRMGESTHVTMLRGLIEFAVSLIDGASCLMSMVQFAAAASNLQHGYQTTADDSFTNDASLALCKLPLGLSTDGHSGWEEYKTRLVSSLHTSLAQHGDEHRHAADLIYLYARVDRALAYFQEKCAKHFVARPYPSKPISIADFLKKHETMEEFVRPFYLADYGSYLVFEMARRSQFSPEVLATLPPVNCYASLDFRAWTICAMYMTVAQYDVYNSDISREYIMMIWFFCVNRDNGTRSDHQVFDFIRPLFAILEYCLTSADMMALEDVPADVTLDTVSQSQVKLALAMESVNILQWEPTVLDNSIQVMTDQFAKPLMDFKLVASTLSERSIERTFRITCRAIAYHFPGSELASNVANRRPEGGADKCIMVYTKDLPDYTLYAMITYDGDFEHKLPLNFGWDTHTFNIYYPTWSIERLREMWKTSRDYLLRTPTEKFIIDIPGWTETKTMRIVYRDEFEMVQAAKKK